MFLADAAEYRVLSQLSEAGELRQSAHQNLELLDRLFAELVDAETGQRGFIITGNPSYLQPYQSALQSIDRTTALLRGQAPADAFFQSELDQLAPLISKKLAALRTTIDLRRQSGFQAAQQQVMTGEGKETMDAIRAILAKMSDDERIVIARRYTRSKLQAERMSEALLLGNVVTYLLLASVIVLLQREGEEHQQAARALQLKMEEARQAQAEIKVLSGLLPICSSCKKIRGDDGGWRQIEVYVQSHSEAEFTHGICPDCVKKLYPELSKRRTAKQATE